jgi:hypothetical protein
MAGGATMSHPAESPRLVIKDNNTSCNERCALCGMWDKANIGPAIFVEGTWNFVCDQCAQREAPWLFAAVQLWQTHEARKEFGGVSDEDYLRQDLLRKATNKPVRGVRQLDYFNMNTGVLDHDKDYDLFGGVSLELRNGDCLRLQICEGYSQEDVIKGLELMLDWVRNDPSLVQELPHDVESLKQSTLDFIKLRFHSKGDLPKSLGGQVVYMGDASPFAEDVPPWLMNAMQNDSDDFDNDFWGEVLS